MRKVIFQMMVSLDGYFEGPNREIDWHIVDREFNDYAIDLLNNVDLLIFGRITYELMAGYWPLPDARANDPVVANLMNSLPKIVFSTTLSKVNWNNTALLKENLVQVVTKLKQQTQTSTGHPAKDIAIFGSSNLALTFIENNLIDEFRIIVSPQVLGQGKPLFKGIKNKLTLKLIKVKTFRSGNVLLYYQP